MTSYVFDHRTCYLGEGPLWHPTRKQLFWFDIVNARLLSRVGDEALMWQLEEHHSAAGWIDHETLLIASETGLWRFDIESGQRSLIVPLEADRPETRSNDGRADRQGGFWIGTMGKKAERGEGTIYRFYKGELVKLFDDLTIPNAICFAPDGRTAYFACTKTGKIQSQALDAEGWPEGAPEVFVDLTSEGLNPMGRLWMPRVRCGMRNGALGASHAIYSTGNLIAQSRSRGSTVRAPRLAARICARFLSPLRKRALKPRIPIRDWSMPVRRAFRDWRSLRFYFDLSCPLRCPLGARRASTRLDRHRSPQ